MHENLVENVQGLAFSVCFVSLSLVLLTVQYRIFMSIIQTDRLDVRMREAIKASKHICITYTKLTSELP